VLTAGQRDSDGPPMAGGAVEGYRLSPAQERLWRLQADEPANAVYRVQALLYRRGTLDVPRLRSAIAAVVDRYEILRTAFPTVAGASMPLQVVHAGARLELQIDLLDLQRLDLDASERQIEAAFDVMRRLPVDAAGGDALRVCVITRSPDEHFMLVAASALCADAPSLAIILRDVARVYDGGVASEGDAPLQYADIAEWQHELLESPDPSATVFWADPARTTPTRAGMGQPSRVSTAGFEAHRIGRCLDESLGRELRRIAEGEGCTPDVLLLAAWISLVSRMTPDLDIVVGVGCTGRSYEELRDAVGLFQKFVPLHCHPSKAKDARELVRHVAALAAETEAMHEAFRWPQAEANAAAGRHTSFFPVCFEHVTWPGTATSETGWSLYRLWSCADRFALKLTVVDTSQGMQCDLYFDAGHYTSAQVELLHERLETWLRRLVAPEHATEQAIMGPVERRRLLEEVSGAANRGAEWTGGVHELFARQAAATPSATAVREGEVRITYAQLRRRASRLAAHLRALNAGPETIVAICLERSAQAVVAILGILEAGAAYLPIDPGNPSEHIAFVLADSCAKVIVSAPHLVDRLPDHAAHVVYLDDDAAGEDGSDRDAPISSRVTPRSLAYVLYTSGSTGRPKGVMIEHGSLANYIAWVRRTLLGGAAATVPWLTELTFDACLKQLFVPLTTGREIRILPRTLLADPAALLSEIAAIPNAGLNCVPSLWDYILDALDAGRAAPPSSLVALFVGGEALRPALVARTRTWFPDLAIWNLYGPTETTANTTAASIADPDDAITIGTPVAGTQVYVVDGELALTGFGVAGELCAAGVGLARGYLARPELTAQRFVPSPFGDAPGARLYRTGDLARMRPDGRVEFLGRADEQIKIWGHRIEPGEIEAALSTHPSVRRAVVMARQDPSGQTRLVAYVVLAAGATLSGAELRTFVQGKVPEYMVPAAFVHLEALSLTPHGKIDRQALPEPEWGGRPEASAPPRTVTEEILAGLWMTLLGRDRLGVRDNFFDAGGHSLLATQLVSRIREVFHVELPLRVVFEAPTLGELAVAVERARAGGEGLLPPIERLRPGVLPPLSAAQRRLWMIDRIEAGSPFYNLSGAVRLTGALRVDVLERAFTDLTRRQPSLRTVVGEVDGRPVQIVRDVQARTIPLVDLAALPEGERDAEVTRYVDEGAATAFALSKGPLVRLVLLRMSESDHVLVVSLHHLISDGWSNGVLVRELAAIYAAFCDDRPSPLPELAIDYADYAAWQEAWCQGAVLERGLRHWRERLRGAPHLLDLPTDRPRPRTQSYRGGQIDFALDEPSTERVHTLSRREGVTPFMTLLAAFELVLAQRTGLDDFLIGTVTANRHRLEVEHLIGLFANQLVLRANVSPSLTVRAHLAAVRQTALDAFAHQELPFDLLVKTLQPVRDLARSPLVQVEFVLQPPAPEPPSAPGLSLAPVQSPLTWIHTDLAWTVTETRGTVKGFVQYSSALFDDCTILDLIDDYRLVLTSMCATPDALLEHSIGDVANAARERREARDAARAEADRAWFRQQTTAAPAAGSRTSHAS
jgi:amino acid adenylation domain-containing protein